MAYEKLEPGTDKWSNDSRTCIEYSKAVSLKRIADVLEGASKVFAPFAPVVAIFGDDAIISQIVEGLSEGIAEAAERRKVKKP